MTFTTYLLVYRRIKLSSIFSVKGIKSDLRDDPETKRRLEENRQQIVTVEAAEDLARREKIPKYIECSPLTGYNVQEVCDSF